MQTIEFKQKLLFTGSSGFLGENIKSLLDTNYDVKTLGLGENENYKINLSNEIPQLKDSFEIVLHAAGKAHSIPKTKSEIQAFYDVNLQGTINLCKALEFSRLPKAFVFISTVAVYGCETGELISEKHPLNGITPYADSKIKAEEFLAQWCKKNNVILSIIRPSLIAGSNPPGNLGAMIAGIKQNRYLSIAGGRARKSVLMVEDIAKLIPKLIDKGGVYNVCDSENPSFRELEVLICRQLNKNRPFNLPYGIAYLLAKCGDILGNRFPLNSDKLTKITKSLTFDNSKARDELNWHPTNVKDNFKII